MTSRIPKRLKNFNLIIQGRGNAGLISEVTLPEFKLKTDAVRNGGMDADLMDDVGMEAMELSWSSSENQGRVYSLFGLSDPAGVVVRFVGAMTDGVTVENYEVEARGRVASLSPGSAKAGEPNEPSHTMNCTMVKVTINGVRELYIDVLSMIREIGGVDQLKSMRDAISD